LVASDLKDALSVPSQAVVINPRGKFVFTLEKDGKANMIPIKVVYEYQGTSVITGIQAGDKVVVEGKQNLRPGSKTRESKSPATPAAQAAPTSATDKK
jgi:hypothetical protein